MSPNYSVLQQLQKLLNNGCEFVDLNRIVLECKHECYNKQKVHTNSRIICGWSARSAGY